MILPVFHTCETVAPALALSPAPSAAATAGVVAVERKLKTTKLKPKMELLTPSAASSFCPNCPTMPVSTCV